MNWRVFLSAALCLGAAACGEGSVSGAIAQQEAEIAREAEQNLVASRGFLARERARQGVTALPSGVLYEIVSRGRNQSLPTPSPQSTVLVHYEGRLADGAVFDSSLQRGEPAQFPVQGVIPGFAEALQLMRPGDEFIAFIPPELGYGSEGQPGSIPGNSALVFRIQLLAFQDERGQLVRAP